MTKKKPSANQKRRGGRTEEAAHVQAARRRELVRLRAEGYSLAEIAHRLRVHRNTVTKDLSVIEQECLDDTRRTMEAIVQREVQRLEMTRSQAWRDYYARANEHGETRQQAYLELVLTASTRLARLLRLNEPAATGGAMSRDQKAKVIEVNVKTREQVDLINKGSIDFENLDALQGRSP